MPFQSVPNTIEVTTHGVCNSQPVVNTFYFATLANYSAQEVEDIAVAVWDWWAADMNDIYPIAFLLSSVKARGLENENDFEFVHAPGTIAGTIASNPTPSNVCFCVSRRSALTGRSARGRVYIGPIAIGSLQTDENLVSSTWAASLVTALNLLHTTVGPTLSMEEVIVSRYNAGAQRAVGVTFDVVNYTNVDLRVDSQRGRLPIL